MEVHAEDLALRQVVSGDRGPHDIFEIEARQSGGVPQNERMTDFVLEQLRKRQCVLTEQDDWRAIEADSGHRAANDRAQHVDVDLPRIETDLRLETRHRTRACQ